ncbi:MAG: hypothetical protein BZY80_00680 [SAR202 cluster bacterium Io17-Chloro-G2]|nr:MAG: hypothetical protein BZY80_00680 [SAR202 cluster bacterium Io17-Chloro-G2]
MRILLAIHILAAVIFLGNIITAAFWKVRADKSGNLETMSITSRSLQLADIAFTMPGVITLLVTGVWMVGITGWQRFQEPWLGISLVLLILTAIISAAGLVPLQKRMVRLSGDQLTAGTADPAYRRASRTWAMMGGVATLLPVVILILMVLKPGV